MIVPGSQASKLGQPQPESNFCSLVKRRCPQPRARHPQDSRRGHRDTEILRLFAHGGDHQRAGSAVAGAVFDGDDAIVTHCVIDHRAIGWENSNVVERDALTSSPMSERAS
jgi:hypothetical protein